MRYWDCHSKDGLSVASSLVLKQSRDEMGVREGGEEKDRARGQKTKTEAVLPGFNSAKGVKRKEKRMQSYGRSK